ncbi:MAG: hypothetical protein KAT77_02210 [Nanoarchaeota archaeon]|nr:hypothetical protein [Nanoarchaeota archaeon]
MVLVVRYGEIFLKGKNRLDFEKKLVGNIKKMFDVKVLRKRNRLLVEDGADLRRVLGLISYSPAVSVDLDIEKIKEKVLEVVKEKNFETFAVVAKRMGSKFLNSQEINEKIGEFVLEKVGKKVNLSKPDLTIGIEVIDDKAYVFTETILCFGGLPVGVEGKVVLLVEDEQSLLAGLLVMKRGCDLEIVSFGDFDISLLEMYSSKKLKSKRIKSLKEVEGMDLPLVVGSELDEDLDVVVLNPLVGLTLEEISKKISIFKLK